MNNNENIKNETISKIASINSVDGFDPMTLALEFTDLNTDKKRYRLPVNTQMAWFRLKYPEGRIAVEVKPEKEYFVAKARVYTHFENPDNQYLAEGSASRGYTKENPTVSPREWAQTAAVGIALRNAGFGLQADIAGESFEGNTLNEFTDFPFTVSDSPNNSTTPETDTPKNENEQILLLDETQLENKTMEISHTPEQPELTPIEKAMAAMCPISKHKGKTLGDLAGMDPKALKYIADSGEKYSREIADYAKLICEYAESQVAV